MEDESDNINDCQDLKELAKGENSILPEPEMSIWIQPLSLPKQPRLKMIDIGTLICTKITMKI